MIYTVASENYRFGPFDKKIQLLKPIAFEIYRFIYWSSYLLDFIVNMNSVGAPFTFRQFFHLPPVYLNIVTVVVCCMYFCVGA
jgi:hypothetical protein